ncbi:hypothetical protein KUTeg_018629 [Tegillarca granosa]|uniref:Aminoacyl-tRNA synthetase class I anticodon-binding domain-containing protein n=1 Tax=Tegillarca granosa TaxID=220873 RepID=A0ABQ9EIY6_TEGGR|nr:hypothetical protein KUTeg_018629 [Tegillarca granosa]
MYDNFYEPEVIINYLTLTGGGFGFSGDLKLRSYQDLIDNFSISHVTKNPARLQKEKLEWLNMMYLERNILTEKKQELIDKTRKIVLDFLKQKTNQDNVSVDANNNNEISGTDDKDCSGSKNTDLSDDFIYKALKWCIDEGRISRINQIVESDFQFLWLSPKKLDMTIIKDLNVDDVSGVIQNCVDDIEKLNDSQFKTEELSKILKTYSKDKKLKLPSLMMLLRYFLSGSKIGPGWLK